MRRRTRRPDPLRRSLGRHVDHGFRPDIEGLRALAVVAVVVFHARLFGLHGGFIGVDVFFVVSGFLITRLILGELAKTGRLSLAAFWGRRARRLLAASALVVVATALATHVVLPPLTQRSVVTDVVGRGHVHVQHRLRRPAGQLLRRPARPVDPVAAAALLVARGRGAVLPVLAGAARRCWPGGRGSTAGCCWRRSASPASLGFALAAWMTPRAPSWAFFLLPTRMGELLAGALLAVVGTQVTRIPAVVPGGAGLDRAGRHRRRLRALRRGDAVAGHRRARAGARHDGGDRRRIGDPRCVGAGPALGTASCSGSAGTPTRCTSGTGRCSCSPTPAGDRSTGPSASSPW